MESTRREFIRTTAATAVLSAVGMPGASQAFGAASQSDRTEWVKSVCRFCGTGCGVQLGVRDGRFVALRGDPEHPTTKGLVCAKALFLPKIVYSKDRLKYPMIRKKAILTTVIATVLFVLAFGSIQFGWITLDDISFIRLPSER